MKMTTIEQLACFAYSLEEKNIPEKIINRAKLHLLDSIACMLASSQLPIAKTTLALIKSYPISSNSQLIGINHKSSSENAALYNGILLRYLDANDISSLLPISDAGHFSDVIPSLLAIAEENKITGKEFIFSIILAYELQARLGLCFNFMKRGFHSLTKASLILPIVLARLDNQPIEIAINAAAINATTNWTFNTWLIPSASISNMKALSVGLVGKRALEAIKLAKSSMSAPKSALDTCFKYLEKRSNKFTPLKEKDDSFYFECNIIKAYPAQIFTQSAIDLVLQLQKQNVKEEDIEFLTLYGHKLVCSGVQGSKEAFIPQNRGAADHSTPFVMAMALLNGRMTLREYHDSSWTNSKVLAAMKKIRLVVDSKLEKKFQKESFLGVRLNVKLKNNKIITLENSAAKGHPLNPFTFDTLEEKIKWLLDEANQSRLTKSLIKQCQSLNSSSDLKNLIDFCSLQT